MKWFKSVFLPSFGTCDGKQVTYKQAEIFKKYLKNEREQYNSYYYYDVIDGLKITLQESRVYNGCHYDNKGRRTLYRKEYFITIKKDTTEKRKQLREKIKELNRIADKLYLDGEKEELEKIEKQIYELEKELSML